MGIPSLFRTLVSKYPECCHWDSNLKTEHLYLDFNCLIHQCVSKLKIDENSIPRDIEEELITQVISYTSHIITKIIKPSRLVYIAVDGPVPMGKIIQQRNRRYKKVQDDNFKKKLNEKYNIPDTASFNSNKITPGTLFMQKLSARLKNLAQIGAFSTHITNEKNFSIFISDSNIPGEGEHKIFEFMKKNKNQPNSVIYGLDADLIILGLSSLKQNIKLLRETLQTNTDIYQYNINNDFVFFDIDIFRNAFLKEYDLESFETDNIMKDIIFISFLGGNDFVESLINCKIRDNNFTKLISFYKEILFQSQSHIICDDKINFKFFSTLINKISMSEDQFVKKKLFRTGQKTETIDYDSELQQYYHSFYTCFSNPFNKYYENDFQKISYKLPHSTWKKQHNQYFFSSDVCNENIIEDYIISLIWTYEYYTKNKAPSWTYHYKYRVAPCPTDIAEFLKSSQYIENKIANFQFDITDPISPVQQLLYVTPPQHFSLLPSAYQHFLSEESNPLKEYFPLKIKLDVVKGMKNIYSDPLFPEVNFNQINSILENIPILEVEASRNVLRDKLFCLKI